MTITNHAFTNTDAEYDRIKALLGVIEARPDIDNNWEPGRMDFWRYNYHVAKDVTWFQDNCHYWQTASGQVVGLFVSEYGGTDFFAVVHPDHWDLLPEILHWAADEWGKDKVLISTDVYTFGQHKIAALLAAGYKADRHIENVRVYDLRAYDFAYTLKPDFTMLRCADFGNDADRVALVQNAFSNPNFTLERLYSTQQSPNYRSELDLVIVNAAGKSVGYCIGWVEENDPKVGFIEPMGVHSDYRQLGFGKALAKECFRRLADLGVETAWIASGAEPNVSNYLYDALEPVQVKRSYRYILELAPQEK